MIRIKFLLILIAVVIGRGISLADNIRYTQKDSLIFESYLKTFESKKDQSISALTIETAKYFLGRPYVAHTLEVNDEEKLVVNLREFDCTTFVESCMALARTLKSEEPSFQTFCNWLKKIRYRNAEIADYSSRLHYISDWAYAHRDFLEDVGESAGGRQSTKEINFMSKNSHLYKHLKDNSANLNNIKEIETLINKRAKSHIIPKTDISKQAKNLKDGDIVVFATSIAGLDYTHIGFVYHENNILKFIHASSLEKQTVIEKKSLQGYCNQSKQCTGVTILRQKN